MSDELIGTTLDTYEIQMVLGKGGMSTVYLARQADRMVALKVLPREFMHDDTFLLRFQAEMRTVADLEHPHILPVYETGEADSIPYIAMRYIPGGTLSDLIDKGLPPLADVTRILKQIGSALDYAHEREIIHRDMKPSNILLDGEGSAYLTDFGVARTVSYQGGLTGSRVIGTPPYIAPEAVRHDGKVTLLVDVYALGIIAYQMLAGHPPFRNEDPMKVLIAHVLEPIPSLRDVNPTVSPPLEAVVRRALDKTPANRYQSAGEFARAFEAAADKRTVSPQATLARPTILPTKRVMPNDDEQQAAPERRRIPWGCIVPIGVAVVLTLAIAATALALNAPAVAIRQTPTATATYPLPTATDQPTATPAQLTATEVPLLPPPNGGDRLAFASGRDGDFDIYIIDIDGSNLQNITDNEVIDFDPAWSPDGQRIVYASRPTSRDPAQIWIMGADGSDPQPITDVEAVNSDPHWSPDGEWIVYSSDENGSFDLFLIRPDGSDKCQLTDSIRNDLTPRWSPDGTRIGYHSREGADRARTDLFAVAIDPDQPCDVQQTTRLTDNDIREEWLHWSPDGTQIVFAAGEAGDIVLLDLETDTQQTLVESPGQDDDPAFSPDGTRIAFDSDRDGDDFFDLYILDITSGNVTQLTTERANDVVPVWQPR